MSKIVRNGLVFAGSATQADEIKYNSSESTLSATTMQGAIDELDTEKVNSSSLSAVATSGAYSDLTGTPESLPARGGDADTVSGHTVAVNVPADAKFTDTNTWRPLGTGADQAAAGNHNHDSVYQAKGNYLTGITKSMVTTALGYTPPTTDTNTWRPLGTGATDACAGNDARLSNARPANGGTSAACSGNSATASRVLDYGNTSAGIYIGFSGAGLTKDNMTHIAGYTENGTKIKDASKDVVKAWLGDASSANKGILNLYNAAECTTFTSDTGACTPAAVKKAVGTFPSLGAVKALYAQARWTSSPNPGSTLFSMSLSVPSGYSCTNSPVSISLANSGGSGVSSCCVYQAYYDPADSKIKGYIQHSAVVTNILITAYILAYKV